MRRAAQLAAFVAVSMCATGTQADPYAYATSFDVGSGETRLLQIDLATGVSTLVGRTAYIDVEGLAIAPDGTLYGVSDASKTLITIDTSFGRGTAVGPGNGNLGVAGQGVGTFDTLDLGLAFSCDGRLWMSSDSTGKLWEVNRNTGATRLVGTMGANISGLAGNADGLYGVGVEATRGLYKINTETAVATRVGAVNTGAPYVDAGMDSDSAGNLWAVLDYSPPPNNRPGDAGKQSDVVRVNAVTGAYTYVSRTFSEVEGLAIGRPPACAVVTGSVPAIPANAWQALAVLGLMVLGFGAFDVRRALR
ncbi:MAG: hypothetical protein SGI99_15080 [Pseudomonadota bacterium]|nr:hypothetical protein [Pseudomonadota bacterium]